jgi:hypothetical protein
VGAAESEADIVSKARRTAGSFMAVASLTKNALLHSKKCGMGFLSIDGIT